MPSSSASSWVFNPLLVEIIIVPMVLAGRYLLLYFSMSFTEHVNLGFIALHSVKSPIEISTLFSLLSILYFFIAPFCFMIFNISIKTFDILLILTEFSLALFAFLIIFNASATISCDILKNLQGFFESRIRACFIFVLHFMNIF